MKLHIQVEVDGAEQPSVYSGESAADALAFINSLKWGDCAHAQVQFSTEVNGEKRGLARTTREHVVALLADAASWLQEVDPSLKPPEEEPERVTIKAEDVGIIEPQDFTGGV